MHHFQRQKAAMEVEVVVVEQVEDLDLYLHEHATQVDWPASMFEMATDCLPEHR
jgi:hypothetical protein